MDLVNRLIARAQGAATLSGGSFSDLAAEARDDQWIDQCASDSSEREAGLATELLLRALHTADLIVTEIESQGLLLEFFSGTARDILLYESLYFSVHALSDALLRTLQLDRASAVMRSRDIACLAASVLGSQHIGEFDSSSHGFNRTQCYLPHVGQLREMTECLVDILISARGAMVIEPSDALRGHEVGIDIEVSLRSAVKAAVDGSVGKDAEILSRSYAERPDQSYIDRGFV